MLSNFCPCIRMLVDKGCIKECNSLSLVLTFNFIFIKAEWWCLPSRWQWRYSWQLCSNSSNKNVFKGKSIKYINDWEWVAPKAGRVIAFSKWGMLNLLIKICVNGVMKPQHFIEVLFGLPLKIQLFCQETKSTNQVHFLQAPSIKIRC